MPHSYEEEYEMCRNMATMFGMRYLSWDFHV